MATVRRRRDQGREEAERLRRRIGQELRDARLSAGLSQTRVAQVSGLSQPVVSRVERARRGPGLDALAALSAVLGYRLSVKLYPSGSPVRDAAQLRLLQRFTARVSTAWERATEVLVGPPGDLRAWDLRLAGPGTIGIDAETRLHDLQALQRRCEAKGRDSGVDRVVLLVADTHHNRRALREYREALRSTFPLDTKAIMAALRAGELPGASGLVVL